MTPEASGAVVVEKELDALVARQVMGWEPAEMLGPSRAQAFWADEDVLVVPRDFSPSTSISDAWRVVERMRELGWIWVSGNHFSTVEGKPFWARFLWGDIPNRGWNEVAAESLPRAICLAALKSLALKAVSAAGALREKGE